jgi:hypothetical protein
VREQLRVGLQPPAHLGQVGLVGMTDGDHKLGSEEQMYLAQLHDLDRIDVAGRPQDHERRFVIAFQLRSLVRVDGILDGQVVQIELLGNGVDLIGAGSQQPDPTEAAPAAWTAAQRLEGLIQRRRGK